MSLVGRVKVFFQVKLLPEIHEIALTTHEK